MPLCLPILGRSQHSNQNMFLLVLEKCKSLQLHRFFPAALSFLTEVKMQDVCNLIRLLKCLITPLFFRIFQVRFQSEQKKKLDFLHFAVLTQDVLKWRIENVCLKFQYFQSMSSSQKRLREKYDTLLVCRMHK